ncbi:PE-PGRS family protein [Myxococcus sp. CA056]|uniref:chondroitinase-B domain-containing protein n=1 Tax=unclassified Myxococcus TaxID=2648731 RepID=UPI00157B674D|nr:MULTISPECIES: chondroitinase-B domain-containing protein [unclassified Myxococcus]NTX16038.1 PE-PGRS family protein [Myxococcus sp. CA056]NTX40971.1 PE-PGRS family protein [Myxococcus sp. CA033]NTX52477.1 PE-PGRS family protein [Myxococcus sp. CA039A]
MRPSSLVLLLLPLTGAAAVKNVSTVAELQAALASAKAGDDIVLADGTYTVNANLDCKAEGTEAQPITVRAANRHAALIRFNAVEGFKVSGRSWVFDGLTIEGICARDPDCEHAFHVTGHAEGFVLRHSRVRDFNAQLKANATKNTEGVFEMPHRGLIEHNDIYDTRPRATSTPVTKLNIDTGDDWVVRDNELHDFSKQGGISYGAFMKSGGKRGLFERNRVVCARDLPASDTRIGLSFGGGGTGAAFCAPAFDANVPCDPEHSDGILRNNIVANCSDVAVYLNRATRTKVLFNTFIGTTGVDFRFASSTGEAHGNVLSSVIRGRDTGSFTAGTNLMNVATATWTSWYAAPLQGDLTLKGSVSQLVGAAAPNALVSEDFCRRPRPSTGAHTLGALEHSLGNCEPGTGEPDAGSGTPDAGSGQPDSGSGNADAGPSDAGSSDAGPGPDKDAPGDDGGCSASPGLWPLLLALLVPLSLRRRFRRE